MKIFLPFQITGIGGTASFALKFKEGLERQGHEVFFEYRSDYDILFCIVQAPFAYLQEAKRRRKPIVQRLDGMWYWSVAGWKFPLYNLKAAITRHFFADYTIYQSEYSRSCTKKFLGTKRPDPSSLVYNGVDLDRFSPEGELMNLRDYPEQKLFFTASAFRREDQIVPILHALEIYRKKYGENWKFLVAGTFSGKLAGFEEKLARYKNVVFVGKIENTELPMYERSVDVFLFTHLNPPCPNNILEALGCGLPVSGVADGAMPELITPGMNGLLIPAKGTGFWKPRSLDLEKFADNIQEILTSQDQYSQASRRVALERFSLHQMIEEYSEAMTKLLST
jgi:glycosyltransferase involved in cell wall biosynthesis